MKVPKIFIPEKKLENATEKLLHEKDTPKPRLINKQDLEEVLQAFDQPLTENFNARVDSLISKSDYQCLKVRSCYWEYWHKPAVKNLDESHVLVRSLDKYGFKHYASAKVDNLKLENFCRLFEKYYTGVLSGINHNKPCFQIGMITGTLGGTVPFFINPALVNTVAFVIPIIGLIGGAFGGTYLARCMHKKYAKKLVRCYEEIETFSKDAIKKAFENESP